MTGVQTCALPIFPDNNIGEADHMIINMEIKEEYNIYFIEFREINST